MSDLRDDGERRWELTAALTALLSLVSDGWAGKPSPLVHQVLLIPAALLLAWLLWRLLKAAPVRSEGNRSSRFSGRSLHLSVLASFQAWSLLLILAETRHYRQFGYHLGRSVGVAAVLLVAFWIVFAVRRSAWSLLAAVLGTYAAGLFLAIRDFPLNYLRSDMLPVIGWADDRLLHHLNPYGTMHVGLRTYDFPYLPGMLVAYLPAAALRVDLRYVNLAAVVVFGVAIFLSARPERRSQVAALVGLFVLCPFLQYRHDIYLHPHWLALVAAVVLMQRSRPNWAGFAWGVSCGIYQLSWVMFPFAILYGFRRRGIRGAAMMMSTGAAGALAITGPFLGSAFHRIASNTVGQWSHLPHALADPINVSYWLTYVLRPDRLKWVQAVVLIAIFGICWLRGRCASLADTLRWMCVALAVFIPLNVLVDGYFYLTLLLMVILFVCAENGWWAEPAELGQRRDLSVDPDTPRPAMSL